MLTLELLAQLRNLDQVAADLNAVSAGAAQVLANGLRGATKTYAEQAVDKLQAVKGRIQAILDPRDASQRFRARTAEELALYRTSRGDLINLQNELINQAQEIQDRESQIGAIARFRHETYKTIFDQAKRHWKDLYEIQALEEKINQIGIERIDRTEQLSALESTRRKSQRETVQMLELERKHVGVISSRIHSFVQAWKDQNEQFKAAHPWLAKIENFLEKYIGLTALLTAAWQFFKNGVLEVAKLHSELGKSAARLGDIGGAGLIKTANDARNAWVDTAIELKKEMPMIEMKEFSSIMSDLTLEGIKSNEEGLKGLTKTVGMATYFWGEGAKQLLPMTAQMLKFNQVAGKSDEVLENMNKGLGYINVGFGKFAPQAAQSIIKFAQFNRLDDKQFERLSRGASALGGGLKEMGMSAEQSSMLIQGLMVNSLTKLPPVFRHLYKEIRDQDFTGVVDQLEMVRMQFIAAQEAGVLDQVAQQLGFTEEQAMALAQSTGSVSEAFNKMNKERMDQANLEKQMALAQMDIYSTLMNLYGVFKASISAVGAEIVKFLSPLAETNKKTKEITTVWQKLSKIIEEATTEVFGPAAQGFKEMFGKLDESGNLVVDIEKIKDAIVGVLEALKVLGTFVKVFLTIGIGVAKLINKVGPDFIAWSVGIGFVVLKMTKLINTLRIFSGMKAVWGGMKALYAMKMGERPEAPKVPDVAGGTSDTSAKAGGGRLGGIMNAIGKIDMSKVLKGAAAMLVVAGAVYVFAKAVKEFQGVTLETFGAAIGSLVALTTAVIAIGLAMKTGVGAAAVLAGAAAMVVMAGAVGLLGLSLQTFGGIDMMEIGQGMAMMGLGLGAMVLGTLGGTALVPLAAGMTAFGLAIRTLPEDDIAMIGLGMKNMADGMQGMIASRDGFGAVIDDLERMASIDVNNLEQIGDIFGNMMGVVIQANEKKEEEGESELAQIRKLITKQNNLLELQVNIDKARLSSEEFRNLRDLSNKGKPGSDEGFLDKLKDLF